MNRYRVFFAVLAALALTAAAQASDPVGIYALIDKVVPEPSVDAPERVQVWGVFAVANPQNRDDYLAPVRGYLYYKLVAGKEEVCRKEWADLKKVAGTGQAVALASRYSPKGRVRPANEKLDKPDAHPVAAGLYKVNNTHPTVQQLFALAAPLAPGEREEVEAGTVTLRTQNIRDTQRKVQYMFELVSRAGDKETSEPVAAGDKETSWTPRTKVKAGEKYTWRVWAVADGWKGPVASSTFQGKAAR